MNYHPNKQVYAGGNGQPFVFEIKTENEQASKKAGMKPGGYQPRY